LQHVVVEYAGPASDNGSIYTTGAVRVRNAAPFIDSAVVRHSGSSGIAVECGPSMRISNNTVLDNGWSGIAVSNQSYPTECRLPVYITDNTVARNAIIDGSYYSRYPGISVYTAGGQITGNVIEANLDSGIYTEDVQGPALPQTIVDGNIVRRNHASEGAPAAGAHLEYVKFTNNEV